MEYYKKEVSLIVQELGVDEEKGLSTSDAKERIEKYGKNQFTPPPKETIIKRIIDNIKEPLIIILLISGIISLLMGHLIDGLAIFAAVLLATTISVVMEGRSDKAFEALSKQGEDISVKTLRDGNIDYINKTEITVGDIVYLEVGDKVPADGRIIQSLQLKVDESMLTGEADAVSKNSSVMNIDKEIPLAERKNIVYAGTLVIEGRAKIIITSVGDSTEMGKIANELKDPFDDETPLQEKLADLGKKISIVGSVAAGIIFLFEIYNIYTRTGMLNFEQIKEAFVVSVALIVAAVPEGLPTMIALTLAFNMQKMAKHNALVRKMIACETIGSVNVICSDKTGTLTQNQMTVMDVWCNGIKQEVSSVKCSEMIDNFCINTVANITKEEKGYKFVGNPTECSLLVCMDKNKINYEDKRVDAEIVHEFEFSSDRKMMSTAVKAEKGFKLYSKGSPEKILSLSDKVLINGKIEKLSKDKRKNIEDEITALQKQAKRVLAFAYKDINSEPDWDDGENVERDLIFTGFVGIEDPLREDVKESVERCRRAGISVKMLTGDNINTARAIAEQLGIIKKDSLVMEVTEIEKMSDDELSKILDRLVVLARSNPSAKMRIVKLLKDKGDAVVVTGDGINDAPALKNADVGVAMGIAGTEVSKESSDIVLLDDSFSTIVKSVKWGRAIYENFQRFIQFQLTVNVVAFITVILAELLKLPMPFTVLQLLWVNIIMDGPPALSLGLEPPREHLLKKKPIRRNASIITMDMLFRIVTNGLFIVAGLLVVMLSTQIFGYALLGGAAEQQSTIVFTTFVLFTLWNAFNCREFGNTSVFVNIFKNRVMLGIMALTFLIQVAVTQYGGEIFRTVPLELDIWLNMIVYTFSIIVFNELIKLIKFTALAISGKTKNA